MQNNEDNSIYKILSTLFTSSTKIKKLKKLKKEEERKKESENFITECNKLMSIKAQNDDQNFMAKSFILSNNDLIEWSLKYCNIKTKDEYENMKEKFILL